MTGQAKPKLTVAVNGCTGRVGQLVIHEILSGAWGPDLTLSGGVSRRAPSAPTPFFMTPDAETLLVKSDAVIDFTNPETAVNTARLAAGHRVAYVTGTTGLNTAQEKELRDASTEIPIVYAANMSVGVTLLAALVEQAAAKLGPGWDAEILETHHRNKADAPSGTALMLGHATGRPAAPADRAGKRETGMLGYAVRRGGDVVGEHTVTFYGEGERIDLSHIATDRRLFARGAIRAALWVANRKPGLYSMRDVLGL